MSIGDSITQRLAQNADLSPDYSIYDSYPYLVNNVLKRKINIHAAGGSAASDQFKSKNQRILIFYLLSIIYNFNYQVKASSVNIFD